MARLCVVGLGYVGLVTAVCFTKLGHYVIGVDKDPLKIDTLMKGIPTFFEPDLDELLKEGLEGGHLSFSIDIESAINQSEIIFICVGTPMEENGQADLSQIEDVARTIAGSLNDYKLIVEKSTVPAGTSSRIKQTINLINGNSVIFDVASNPEFLREGSAITDFIKPDRIILGVESGKPEKILRDLYSVFNCPLVVTDIATAELIKHASNAFLAMKISYINLIADICEKVSGDINSVADGMGYDRRIGRDFLYAGVGYGGSCFPKDIAAFAAMATSLGVDVSLLKEVDRINQNRVNSIINKIEEAIWVCKNKNIAVLGLAFKSNTDDIRESPGVKLIKELTRKGSKVTCYDPKAMDNARHELADLRNDVSYANTSYEAVNKADALVIMTEWPEFSQLDFRKIKTHMRIPVIVDGRNILQADDLEKLGFWYSGIGRGYRKGEAFTVAQ